MSLLDLKLLITGLSLKVAILKISRSRCIFGTHRSRSDVNQSAAGSFATLPYQHHTICTFCPLLSVFSSFVRPWPLTVALAVNASRDRDKQNCCVGVQTAIWVKASLTVRRLGYFPEKLPPTPSLRLWYDSKGKGFHQWATGLNHHLVTSLGDR